MASERNLIQVESTHTTMVRLDLRKEYGWTSFGVLKAYIAECEARGATDNTSVCVVHVEDPKSTRNIYQPVIGVNINHAKASRDEISTSEPAATAPPKAKEVPVGPTDLMAALRASIERAKAARADAADAEDRAAAGGETRW